MTLGLDVAPEHQPAACDSTRVGRARHHGQEGVLDACGHCSRHPASAVSRRIDLVRVHSHRRGRPIRRLADNAATGRRRKASNKRVRAHCFSPQGRGGQRGFVWPRHGGCHYVGAPLADRPRRVYWRRARRVDRAAGSLPDVQRCPGNLQQAHPTHGHRGEHRRPTRRRFGASLLRRAAPDGAGHMTATGALHRDRQAQRRLRDAAEPSART